MIRALLAIVRIKARIWWLENVVAPDPDPRYSELDRRDGLRRSSDDLELDDERECLCAPAVTPDDTEEPCICGGVRS